MVSQAKVVTPPLDVPIMFRHLTTGRTIGLILPAAIQSCDSSKYWERVQPDNREEEK